jgi:hypothetical protein
VRDVGHRDPQPHPSAGQRLDGDGVVEVARGFGIDRGEGDVSEIGPIQQVAIGDRGGQPRRDALDLIRKGVLDVRHRQDLLHLRAWIVGVAQDPQHPGLHGAVGGLRIARDLRDHRLANL